MEAQEDLKFPDTPTETIQIYYSFQLLCFTIKLQKSYSKDSWV